jgi:hypothetical protein
VTRAARDRVAHRPVLGAADALHRSEAGVEHRAGVRGDGAVRRLRRVAVVGRVQHAGAREVPAEVHVRVDEPRQQRRVAEVDDPVAGPGAVSGGR